MSWTGGCGCGRSAAECLARRQLDRIKAARLSAGASGQTPRCRSERDTDGLDALYRTGVEE